MGIKLIRWLGYWIYPRLQGHVINRTKTETLPIPKSNHSARTCRKVIPPPHILFTYFPENLSLHWTHKSTPAKNVTKNSGVKFGGRVTRVILTKTFQKWEKRAKIALWEQLFPCGLLRVKPRYIFLQMFLKIFLNFFKLNLLRLKLPHNLFLNFIDS